MLFRTKVFFTVALTCMSVALLMQIFPFYEIERVGYISIGTVGGVAIEKEQNLYTLNFEQQQQLIQILNEAVPLEEQSSLESASVDSIVIYRLGRPDLQIGLSLNGEDTLVFDVPEWNEGPLQETSGGKLLSLLEEATQP